MTDQSINNLMDFLDVAKLKLNPLPTSYIADKADEYLKNLYATMLASVLVANGMISDNENRLFRLLLDSIGLEGETNSFISNISHLTQKQVLDFAKGLDTDDKRLNFIFEILMLARINSPLNDKQLALINEFCNIWQLDTNDLMLLNFWLYTILGINTTNEIISIRKYLFSVKLSDIKIHNLKVIKNAYSIVREEDEIAEFVEYFKIAEEFDFEIHYWNYREGNIVYKDCGLVHIETLKSIYDLKCPHDGILQKILVNKGKVERYQVFAHILSESYQKIQAPSDGMLMDIYVNDSEEVEYSILTIPEYLKNWLNFLSIISSNDY